WALG
ncbi:hypothetical protein N499_0661B, partial [Wolbachia pipientis wVitA]